MKNDKNFIQKAIHVTIEALLIAIVVILSFLSLAIMLLESIIMLPAWLFKKFLHLLDIGFFHGELHVEEEINDMFDK